MALISLENMSFYSFHGVYEEERIVGNEFRVDLEMMTDTTKSEQSDKLEDTLDYAAVYNLINEQMKIRSALLEHLARRILDSLLKEFPEIEYAEISVSKLNPPMGGQIKKVSVTLSSED